MMRLLWAKALDANRTAIVIDTGGGGQLLGGVVVLTTMSVNWGRGGYYDTLDLKFYWEWSRVVDSPEDFQESREWEHRELPPPQRLLEGL